MKIDHVGIAVRTLGRPRSLGARSWVPPTPLPRRSRREPRSRRVPVGRRDPRRAARADGSSSPAGEVPRAPRGRAFTTSRSRSIAWTRHSRRSGIAEVASSTNTPAPGRAVDGWGSPTPPRSGAFWSSSWRAREPYCLRRGSPRSTTVAAARPSRRPSCARRGRGRAPARRAVRAPGRTKCVPSLPAEFPRRWRPLERTWSLPSWASTPGTRRRSIARSTSGRNTGLRPDRRQHRHGDSRWPRPPRTPRRCTGPCGKSSHDRGSNGRRSPPSWEIA